MQQTVESERRCSTTHRTSGANSLLTRSSEAPVGGAAVASAPTAARTAGRRSAEDKGNPPGNEPISVIASSPTDASPSSSGRMSVTDVIGNMLSGGIAGATVESALYPLDTLKTRLQARTPGTSIQLKGLYSGLAGNIAGVIPASALFFGSYEPIKKRLNRFVPLLGCMCQCFCMQLCTDDVRYVCMCGLAIDYSIVPEGSSSAAQLGAAAAAGTIASLVRVPTEVIKTRLQTRQFKGPIMAVTSVARKEGLGGLYAGYWSFMFRDLPFDAIEFVTYEQAKIAYSRYVVKRDVNPAEASFLGAAAGSFTGLVTTPLDVVKTRLMTQGLTAQYAGVVDCIGKVIRNEGFTALFKGGAARVTWIGVGGSIFFTALESSQRLLVSEAGRKQAH